VATKLANLKKRIEEITGKEIDASAEQLITFAYPVGSAFYEQNSEVLWRRIIWPGQFCVSPVTLLDASGRSTTGSDGKSVFLLSYFICRSNNFFSEPVFLLATPYAANPCYITVTHQIVPDPNTVPNDVQITAYAWSASGTPAPNISFDWRCRVVSTPIII
jgi:hypothetical protein